MESLVGEICNDLDEVDQFQNPGGHYIMEPTSYLDRLRLDKPVTFTKTKVNFKILVDLVTAANFETNCSYGIWEPTATRTAQSRPLGPSVY